MMSASAGAGVISCGSVNGRYQYCAADTGRGVKLERQLSRSPCLQAQSWGYDRGGIRVTEGCAATFSVGDGGGSSRGGRGSHVGAAIVGGMIGAMLGAAASGGGTQRTVSHSYTTRSYSGAPRPEPAWVTEERVHDSRMASIRAGMDPDTDVMAAQLRANEAAPASASDAVRRDADRISNAVEEDMARIDNAGTFSSSSSSPEGDERSEYQANQDFQREVMMRRADENAAAEETPQ